MKCSIVELERKCNPRVVVNRLHSAFYHQLVSYPKYVRPSSDKIAMTVAKFADAMI